jgi:hypothetical protein
MKNLGNFLEIIVISFLQLLMVHQSTETYDTWDKGPVCV